MDCCSVDRYTSYNPLKHIADIFNNSRDFYYDEQDEDSDETQNSKLDFSEYDKENYHPNKLHDTPHYGHSKNSTARKFPNDILSTKDGYDTANSKENNDLFISPFLATNDPIQEECFYRQNYKNFSDGTQRDIFQIDNTNVSPLSVQRFKNRY